MDHAHVLQKSLGCGPCPKHLLVEDPAYGPCVCRHDGRQLCVSSPEDANNEAKELSAGRAGLPGDGQ